MTGSKIDVAIIGGGMGGLALAVGLQKYDHIKVSLYEAAGKFSEIGAGMTIGPNARRAMSLIDPRILEAFEKIAEPGVRFSIWQGYGEKAGEHCVTMASTGPVAAVHRAHLLEELIKLVDPKSYSFGKRLETVSDAGVTEPYVLKFQDGTSSSADVIIGADGIHSSVRPFILGSPNPDARAVFSGHVVYRTLVPSAVAAEVLGHEAHSTGTVRMFGGPSQAVVWYKVNNEVFNLSLIDMTIGDGEGWKHDEWVVPGDIKEFQKKLKGWHDVPKKIASLYPDDSDCKIWAMFEMPPASTYYRGRMAMLGDAAHASLPYQGAGAGQAFEDAMVLERVLGHAGSVAEIKSALQAYDTVRRFRSQKVVYSSKQHGEIVAHRHSTIQGDPQKIQRCLERRMNWIYDADMQLQIDDAIDLMDSILIGQA